MTAKFTANIPRYYLLLTDEQFDERGGLGAGVLYYDRGAAEVTTVTTTEFKTEYSVYPYNGYDPDVVIFSNSGFSFLGYYYNGQLITTSSELTSQDVDTYGVPQGATIYASFKKTIDPNKTYTITIDYGSWDGNSWSRMADGKIGFSASSLSNQRQSIQVKSGEIVTVYAEGDSGNDDSDWNNEPWWYYVRGFYTEGHSAYASYNDINKVTAQYSFTATSDRTIYVDFVYYKR